SGVGLMSDMDAVGNGWDSARANREFRTREVRTRESPIANPESRIPNPDSRIPTPRLPYARASLFLAALLACFAIDANAAGLLTASSARLLRSSVTPAVFRPLINWP